MLITVIRAGKGIFHFTGEVDAYNLEMLRAHITELPDTRLRITLEPCEEPAFQEHARQWLETLSREGVSVSLHRGAAWSAFARSPGLPQEPSSPRTTDQPSSGPVIG